MFPVLEPEFSRIIQLSEIPDEGLTLSIEATAEERQGLARRFGAVAVESLTAQVTLHPKHGRTRWQLDGRVMAKVVQTCVVTLDQVPVHTAFRFKQLYASDLGEKATAEVQLQFNEVLALDQDDAPEPLSGGAIDVGEAVAEEFGLALDPFPRAPGVMFDGYSVGPDDERVSANAFAALAGHRSSDNEKKG